MSYQSIFKGTTEGTTEGTKGDKRGQVTPTEGDKRGHTSIEVSPLSPEVSPFHFVPSKPKNSMKMLFRKEMTLPAWRAKQ